MPCQAHAEIHGQRGQPPCHLCVCVCHFSAWKVEVIGKSNFLATEVHRISLVPECLWVYETLFSSVFIASNIWEKHNFPRIFPGSPGSLGAPGSMKFSKLLDEYQLWEWKGSGNPRATRVRSRVVDTFFCGEETLWRGATAPMAPIPKFGMISRAEHTWRCSARMNRHIGSIYKYIYIYGRKHKTRWIPKVISTANQVFLKSTCVVWRSKHWHSSCQLVNLSTSDRSEAETTSHRLGFHVLINQTRETSRFDKKWVV